MEPIICHTVCPNCQSEERIGDKIIETLKAEGEMREDVVVGAFGWSSPIVDPLSVKNQLRPTPQMWLASIRFDICAKCFTIYPMRVDLNAMSQMRQPNIKPS